MSTSPVAINYGKHLVAMFEQKKFGEEFTPEQLKVLARFKNCNLLRTFIDPSVEFALKENNVPTLLEIDLCLLAMSGRPFGGEMSVKEKIRVVKSALSHASDIHSSLGITCRSSIL